MVRCWQILFGAKAQVVIGFAAMFVGALAWVTGAIRINTAASWKFWEWSDTAYIFHVSMFFGEVACYAIVATGLGFKKTEEVEEYLIESDKV